MKRVVLSTMVAFGVITLWTSCKNKEKSQVEEEVKIEETTEEPEEVTDMHNAANSLDFEGVYEGTIPCADCEGIKTTVTIGKDHAFTVISEYLGKEGDNTFTDKGTWDIEESTITLKQEDESVMKFFVGEGFIQFLDQEGNKIEGDMADMYILKKTE
ncbi:copper resistance protein NlpE [Sinomicrobium weinanense]|uniref:Copper resistance protein NlpE N-terminal domain-containing protein n=1 Tax=Sinomicrobium weinanense TaxID=2842200 RepID=A0A926JV65_9FLAO|nr:copper resistance protein NlpE [Sinomicrobium weinanense]MBC9797909.1 copper resistance protein NlpE N-terminal domain-containing protein [Sinomicrobium weinanense]MBU3125446.1 copper resistance protein NlpE [Sinomicrobium weinanense]